MYKCYETEKILYLVLELLTGGELFDTIIAKVCLRTLVLAGLVRSEFSRGLGCFFRLEHHRCRCPRQHHPKGPMALPMHLR